jgi:hypothetical protein
VAQATAAITHQEQEVLVAIVAAACKTLNEARASKCAIALAWEKEKTITYHLKQQSTAAQGITLPQDDDDDRSINTSSNPNPNATLTTHLHAQATGLQNIQSMVSIILKPSSPDYERWCDLVLLTVHRYALDDHVLSDVANPSIYWARLDNIVVTWILGTLSPELYEIVREPTETARQAWLTIKAQFLSNSELCVLQLDIRFYAFKQRDLSISDYCLWMKGMADDIRALDDVTPHVMETLIKIISK